MPRESGSVRGSDVRKAAVVLVRAALQVVCWGCFWFVVKAKRSNINPGPKVHNGSSLPAALGMAGDGWGWLGEGGDGGDGSFVTEITYGKY